MRVCVCVCTCIAYYQRHLVSHWYVCTAVLGVTRYNCNALRNNITLLGNELI